MAHPESPLAILLTAVQVEVDGPMYYRIALHGQSPITGKERTLSQHTFALDIEVDDDQSDHDTLRDLLTYAIEQI